MEDRSEINPNNQQPRTVKGERLPIRAIQAAAQLFRSEEPLFHEAPKGLSHIGRNLWAKSIDEAKKMLDEEKVNDIIPDTYHTSRRLIGPFMLKSLTENKINAQKISWVYTKRTKERDNTELDNPENYSIQQYNILLNKLFPDADQRNEAETKAKKAAGLLIETSTSGSRMPYEKVLLKNILEELDALIKSSPHRLQTIYRAPDPEPATN